MLMMIRLNSKVSFGSSEREAMKIITIVAAIILFSCTTQPSVCDDPTNTSLLCKMADHAGVRIENVATGLIIANSVAIGEGSYTRRQAVGVIEVLISALDTDISYVLFKDLVLARMERYPGLIIVADAYLSQFTIHSPMLQSDKDLLQGWLKRQVEILR